MFGMDQIADGIIGQGLNLAFGGLQDKRQLKQQKKLQELQIAGQKDLTDYTNEKSREMQMQMWNDTNIDKQLQKVKDAGMSVSSMYGGSGAGGATTGSGGGGGSVSGGSAGDPNAGVGMGLQMASQLALMKAQKENIEADTANKVATAEKTAGVDTDLQKQGLDTAKKTQEAIINKAIFEAQKAGEEWTKSGAESQLANRSLEDQLSKIKSEALGQILENEATKTNIKLDKAKIKEITEKIAQGWEGLAQGRTGLEQNKAKIGIERFKEEIKANYPGISDVIGRLSDDIIESIFNIGMNGRKATKTSDNYK